MKFSNTLLTLFSCIFATLAAVQNCRAQNLPQDYVNAHNAVRAAVTPISVGNIAWDDGLRIYAQNYANQRITTCANQPSGGPYGENIAVGFGSVFTGTDAVQMWANEKQYYTYSTNTCATGHLCGHYTQVVWSNSVRVGCARVQCTNGNYFVICSYAPKGNVIGESPY